MEEDKNPRHKVVVIRLPANFQNNLPGGLNSKSIPTITSLNQLQLPDEVIAQMMSGQFPNEYNNTNASASTTTNTNMDVDMTNDQEQNKAMNINMVHDDLNDDGGQLAAMHSTDHPNIHQQTTTNEQFVNSGRGGGGGSGSGGNNHATYTNNNQSTSNNSLDRNNTNAANFNQNVPVPTGVLVRQGEGKSDDVNTSLESGAELQETIKDDDTIQYKNYTPKQREWMLVVLSFARGLLNKPFEIKLHDIVIEKARELLRKNAVACRMERIPTPKTLRSVWKNLWKHPDRTVSSVKKGGRPRIDPALKKQKRNERERKRRAALRQGKSTNETQGEEEHPGPATRRSRRGSRAN